MQINDLLAEHDAIEYVFFEHQSALLHFEWAKALVFLDEYFFALRRHMRYEEECLIPAYEQLGPHIDAGLPSLFLSDHEKMLDLLRLFRDKVKQLAKEPDERGLITLLDREAFYKRLVAHHDKRERNFLYPRLDNGLAAPQVETLLAARFSTRTVSLAA